MLAEPELWDSQVAALQVTHFRESTLEIRMLVSARNSGDAFDLRCQVREKMMAYLQQTHPESLPRQRAELAARLEPDAGDGAG